MITKITLDMLTQDSVSVKTQNYAVINDVEYPIGKPHRKAYVNSVRGRSEVESEIPEPQQNAIFAVWGNEPTVDDSIE